SSARQKASWTTSSASARLCTPKIRVSAAIRRPDSRRNRCSSSSTPLVVHPHHGTDFDRAAGFENRAAARQLHGLIDVTRLDDGEAANDVLGFGERSVGHALVAAHDLAGPLQGLTAILQVTLRFELAHPLHPALHALLGLLRRTHHVLPG